MIIEPLFAPAQLTKSCAGKKFMDSLFTDVGNCSRLGFLHKSLSNQSSFITWSLHKTATNLGLTDQVLLLLLSLLVWLHSGLLLCFSFKHKLPLISRGLPLWAWCDSWGSIVAVQETPPTKGKSSARRTPGRCHFRLLLHCTDIFKL